MAMKCLASMIRNQPLTCYIQDLRSLKSTKTNLGLAPRNRGCSSLSWMLRERYNIKMMRWARTKILIRLRTTRTGSSQNSTRKTFLG